MEPKRLITILLLAFVLMSGVYLAFQEMNTREGTVEQSDAEETLQDAGSRTAATEQSEYPSDLKVIAYYFHGDTRCMTCRKIEAYTYEVLIDQFPRAVNTGVIEWRVVNVDEPENEHFVEDFQQTSRSVVLVDVTAGDRKNWKTLQRVWELVDDRKQFQEYVRLETRAFLEEGA